MQEEDARSQLATHNQPAACDPQDAHSQPATHSQPKPRYQPDFAQLQALAREYRSVPLALSLEGETKTPTELFRVLKKLSRHCYVFESLEDHTGRGRYTFLGYDPKVEITCTDGLLSIKNGTRVEIKTSDPGAHITQILDDYRAPTLPELPPFTGGLVGYFSFDYIKYSEPTLNLNAKDQEGFKDVDLMLFDKVIAFDHLLHKIILIATVRTDDFAENYERALGELDHMARLVEAGTPAEVPPLKLLSDFVPLFDEQQYCRMVERAKQHIFEGDIFQVVLSNRLEARVEGSLFDTYRVLRETNPSPYMFYFSSDDVEIAGASPETLVKVVGREVQTFPLAGTRPRGATPQEDAVLEDELLSDPKELAEHNMLVDLGRNDIGKISEFGTVDVPSYLSIERFSHVMHIGSTVRGTLHPHKTALDAIHAVLPAGTLSGAPKLKACEIINAMEDNKRGIYGGAIGYLGFTGNVDTCITIRIAFKKNGKVFVRSGAGIVADSVPHAEYAECRNKMQAVVNALCAAQGGLAPLGGGGCAVLGQGRQNEGLPEDSHIEGGVS